MPGTDRSRNPQRRGVHPASDLQHGVARVPHLRIGVFDEGVEVEESVCIGGEPGAVLVDPYGLERQCRDDTGVPAPAEDAAETLGVMGAAAGAETPLRVDVFEFDD